MRKIHGVLVSGDSPLPPGADNQAVQPAGSGLALFSPAMSALPNLPPIQDILTAPSNLSSMTMPQNSQVGSLDIATLYIKVVTFLP